MAKELAAPPKKPDWYYQAVSLAIAGATRRQIADHFDVAVSSVQQAIEETIGLGQETEFVQRAIWNERIEAATRALWPKVIKGDGPAIRSLIELGRWAAEINGLKRGVTQAHIHAGQITIRYEDMLGNQLDMPYVIDAVDQPPAAP